MNENRGVFALDGVTGMLIATVLLLTILGTLVFLAVGVQNANATNFYKIQNETEIGSGIMGKNAPSRSDYVVDVK